MTNKKEDSKEINISLSKEDYILIVSLVIISFFLFYTVSLFKHIPSPVYGGDFYMARGFTQGILEGRPFWQDPYFKGNYAHYAWLSYLLTAWMVRITGASLERMSVVLPVLIQIAYLISCYLFGITLFKSKKYGLLFTLAAFSTRIIDMKISGALAIVFAILSFWSLLKYEHGEKKFGYILGLFMGLTALSHVNIFIGLLCLVLFVLFVEFILRLAKENRLKATLDYAKKYFIPFLITIILVLPLAGPWVFVYHMKTLNPAQQYSLQDINKTGIGWIFQVVSGMFVRTSGIPIWHIYWILTPMGIWGLISLFGLVFCILNRKNTEARFGLLILIASILATSHFLITRPLLHNWIVPGHIWGSTIWLVDIVLLTFGIKNLELMLEKLKIERKFVIGAAVLFLFIIAYQNYQTFNNDRWTQYGRIIDPGLQTLFDTEQWILKNTNKEDVFLANDESAFAINALTGRSLVIVRRTHANYYVDVEKRYADAMVMLYGSNKTKTQELLKEYGVTYFYLDSTLVQYPMIVADRKYESYLADNGINYSIQDVHLDPSTLDSPVYTAILVPPQELRILSYNITQPVQQFLTNGARQAILFRITN